MEVYRFLVALIISCAGLVFGFEAGSEHLVYSARTSMYSYYIYALGSFIGAVILSLFSGKLGRKRMSILNCFIFAIGSLIEAFSLNSSLFFVIGQFLVGIAFGCSIIILPIYLSEIAPTKKRGSFIIFYDIMYAIGCIISTLIYGIVWKNTNNKSMDVNTERPDESFQINSFEWKFMLCIQAVPAVIVGILMFFAPESPRWLASKNRNEEAQKVIRKLHLDVDDDDDQLLEDIKKDVNSEYSNSFFSLFGSLLRRRTLIVFLMTILFYFSGSNSIFYYEAQIRSEIIFPEVVTTIVLPVINYILQLIAYLFGKCLVDRVGRKPLLTIGSCLIAVINVVIWFFGSKRIGSTSSQIICLISIMVFRFVMAASWGAILLIYQAEVFPFRVRVKGNIFGYIVSIVFSYIESIVSPILMERMGSISILVFIPLNIIAVLVSHFFFLESKGIKLEDMDDKLGKKEK